MLPRYRTGRALYVTCALVCLITYVQHTSRKKTTRRRWRAHLGCVRMLHGVIHVERRFRASAVIVRYVRSVLAKARLRELQARRQGMYWWAMILSKEKRVRYWKVHGLSASFSPLRAIACQLPDTCISTPA